jgi:lipopolysaccharide exporter
MREKMTAGRTPSESVSRRAAAGAGWIIAWRVATRNIGLLSTLILVRLLQPADFGLVALATGFISSVDALSAIGVQDALVRVPVVTRDLYDTGFGLSVVRGVLTALLVALIAVPVAAFFGDPRLAVIMIALSAGTLIGAFENVGIVDFRRELAFRKEFDMQLWSRIVAAATTVVVAFVWQSYWALIAGILVYRLMRLAQSYLMSPYRPSFSLRAWRQIIGFSLWTWAQTILYQLKERSEAIVIGRILDASKVGVFSVGLELGSLPTTELVEPLGRSLFSAFASLQNSAEGLRNMFLGAIGLGLTLILPAGIGISMIADPMVHLLLGPSWLSAVPVVQIVAVGGTTAIFSHACGNLLNAIGRPHIAVYIATITIAVKLTALLLLVPEFGLSGAAVAIVIASILEVFLLLWLTLPRAGVSLLRVAACIVRPGVATAVMVFVLWQLGMAWAPAGGNNLVDFAHDVGVRSAIGAMCYGIALAGTWLMAGRPDGAERHALSIANDLWARLHRPV